MLTLALVLGAVDSPDPDQNQNGSLTGADVVEEQLREICIFQIANQTVAKDSAARYFVYMKLFTAQCSGLNFTGDCSLQQQVAAGRWLPPRPPCPHLPTSCFTPCAAHGGLLVNRLSP